MPESRTGGPPSAVLEIHDQFLEPDRVRAAYQILSHWPRIPHGLFWCEIPRIERYRDGDPSQADCLREHFGDLTPFLFDLFASLLPMVPLGCLREEATLEFWTGSNAEPSELVYLHVDSHSFTGGSTAPEPHPLLGTIFHLGPDEGIEGGSTFFCTGRPVPPAIVARNRTSMPQDQALALAGDWIEIPRRFNRLIKFEGSLPHFRGKMAAAAQPRVAVFVNLWPTSPLRPGRRAGCALISPAELRAYLKLGPGDARALRALTDRFTTAELGSLIEVYRKLYGGPRAGS
jgi:hypothetical protein